VRRARWIVVVMALTLASVLATGSTPAAVGPFGERCEYVEAGAPGPRGNLLLIVDGTPIHLRRDGEAIKVSYRGPRCTGTQPTVHNIDRIVVREALESEGVEISQKEGRLGPGATPEASGSEIEISLETDRVRVGGTGGADSIRVKTLFGDHVAVNLNRRADGRHPDYDVIVTSRPPNLLKVGGGPGRDLVDARLLTGMGDTGLHRVIRLLGGRGDDVILGSPGSEWLLDDGPGDDLVVAGRGWDSVEFGRGRDTIIGGPGGDDLIYQGFFPRRDRRDPPDRIVGGAGEDQIIDLNGSSDLIRCGPGRDEVEGEANERLSGCERLR